MKDDNILYKGYFRSTLLCVSVNKKMVIDYLVNTRKIDKKMVSIEKEYIINDSIFLTYEDFVLEDFYDTCLPARDVQIITNDYEEFAYKYKNNIDSMKEYLVVLYPLLSKDEYNTVINAIQILVKYQNKPKKNMKMETMFYMCHPMLHMNMLEYLSSIGVYYESNQLDRRYHFIISNT